MNRKKFKTKHLILSCLVLLLGACAGTPQPKISLTPEVFTNEELKIGIAFIPPGKEATTHIFGADCLLCIAVASALTSDLDTHIESTINNDELVKMKELVISEYELRSENIKQVSLPTPVAELKSFNAELGFSKKDFRPLKDELGVDILVILKIHSHGAFRSFSSYIPNGDPQGYVGGLLFSIDLTNNEYVQYMQINEMVQPSGAWDEPPNFPSVTTSYYQAVENAKQKIREEL